MSISKRYYDTQWRSACKVFVRMLCSNNRKNLLESIEQTKALCKIMMVPHNLGLEHALSNSGIPVSPDIAEQILKKFENAGMLAYRFFEWARKLRNFSHTVNSYHTMIRSLAKIRRYKIMWDLVNTMRKERVVNIETFCIIMKKYARAQKVEQALYTFNVMEKFGITPNLVAFNGLLSALCKSKNVRKAQEVFDEMGQRFGPDAKTYSILLEGWGRAPNLPKMREVYREMINRGCVPDIVTYGIMVDSLCKAGKVEEAVELVCEMVGLNQCRPTAFIYSVLVHTYGTEKRIEQAVSTFLEMEQNGIKPDVVVYNALVSAFCKVNKFENAFRVIGDMRDKGISPNSRTYNTILNGLINDGQTYQAYKLFRTMIRSCDPDSDTYTMMIKMFFEIDNTGKALKVWKYMGIKQFVPCIYVFSVMINGLCEKGEMDRACILTEEMMERGMRPSSSTFGRLRKLLLREGREDVLEFLVEKMKVLIEEPDFDED